MGSFSSNKQIASLREYALIAQDERRVEVLRREQDWRGEVASLGDSIRIHDAIVNVNRVYRA